MHLFYTPDIATTLELPQEEAAHALRVLRLAEGDEVMLTDGKGSLFRAEIDIISGKRCYVRIVETTTPAPLWQGHLHLAMAPTKNMDRIEWFAEKATEIGFDELTFLECRFSERKVVKTDRVEKILVSAMKQSLKPTLPVLNGMTPFKKFIAQPFTGQKFIAHCDRTIDEACKKRAYLPSIIKKNENILILIGPEGDFSPEEIKFALENGFEPITLGNQRLRTETAAVVATVMVATENSR